MGTSVDENDDLNRLISTITEYSVRKKIVLLGSRAQGDAQPAHPLYYLDTQ